MINSNICLTFFKSLFILLLLFEAAIHVSTIMEVSKTDDRNPFICSSCDVPYSSSIDSDNCPAYWGNRCTHTMCVGCVKKERKYNGKDYVTQCTMCPTRVYSTKKPQRAHWLIEILLEVEANEKLSRFHSVISEPEPLQALMCSECGEDYTLIGTSVPFNLYCGHVVCMNCIEEYKTERSFEERDNHRKSLTHYFACSACDRSTISTFEKPCGAAVREVMEWIEKKDEEQIESLPRNLFVCSDCDQKTPCDRGFLCNECTDDVGKKKICAFCAHTTHRTHDSDMFLPVKLESVKNASLLTVHSQIVKSNSDANVAVDKYKTLLGKVEERFSNAINTIPMAQKCSDGTKIAFNLKRKAERYEEIMKDVVPAVLNSNKLLEDMLDDLNDSFPETDAEGVDSEEDAESEDGERERKRRRVEESDGESDS